MDPPGKWLEKALLDLCKKMETGLDLDSELISGLVSYCEFAPPEDAKEYLNNIIGEEVGKTVIQEYLRRRGHLNICTTVDSSTSNLQAYIKPPSNEISSGISKKPPKSQKEIIAFTNQETRVPSENTLKGHTQNNSRKKKGGKVISLAEAAKGSIVFQKGKPCSCQARSHRLVGNCLSCGKIVCDQEGEGPCSYCGALVLREGTNYAGLDETVGPLSEAEVKAEAYAKRLVEYDRNSAARTTVIDDQSDYYEIEGNSWLSKEEKDLLRKKREEIEEAEQARRKKVVLTFDLFGRKVLMNEDEVAKLELENITLRPQDEREGNRIKPNPNLRIQPIFLDLGSTRKPDKENQMNKVRPNGLCLEISGRVQHDNKELKGFLIKNQNETGSASSGKFWPEQAVYGGSHIHDDTECSLDYP